MNKKYIVRLTPEERAQVKELVSKGKAAAYKIRHAHILLMADADGPGWTDEQIAEALSVHSNTVRGVRQRFVEHGQATRGRVGRSCVPALREGRCRQLADSCLIIILSPFCH